jgi:hypothetical protein
LVAGVDDDDDDDDDVVIVVVVVVVVVVLSFSRRSWSCSNYRAMLRENIFIL